MFHVEEHNYLFVLSLLVCIFCTCLSSPKTAEFSLMCQLLLASVTLLLAAAMMDGEITFDSGPIGEGKVVSLDTEERSFDCTGLKKRSRAIFIHVHITHMLK